MEPGTTATMKTLPRVAAFDAAMAESRQRCRSGELGTAFVLLERAHVLGQRDFGRHLGVHLAMLRVAWKLNDKREVRGQILRLCLVPLGHLARRLPRGNSGASDVSAFAPMPVSPEFEHFSTTRKREMDCPACKTQSLSMTERQGIEIDYCPKCRGVWLDRGELDKIVERSTAELDSAARAPSPPAGNGGLGRGEYGYGGHPPQRDDRHHGGHYRKSFWKELFD